MQDFTGVPAVVDLAAMRDARKISAATRKRSTRWFPVDLVIDHSVMVDYFGMRRFREKREREYERNGERYEFLKWGQTRLTISASSRRAPASATR
jgi:aconitate hydratase